jgi:mRNA-degrading endonuclease YafQ of YafQ-DinJ toxin-antitoxin module
MGMRTFIGVRFSRGSPCCILRQDVLAELWLDLSNCRIHQLKGRLRGHWSIWVSGNWRVTFRFIDSDIELVDYLDYH